MKVFGFDGADDVVRLIAEDKIAATGMQFPKTMARNAAEYADEYIKGKRDFQQKIPVKVDLVTPEQRQQIRRLREEMIRGTFNQSRGGSANKLSIGLVVLVAGAGFCWLFPPVRLRSLSKVQAARASARFSPEDFADRFWNERLLKSFDQAADAGKVLAAIASSPQKAREQFGRSVGISSSYYFFLRGSGRVVSVDDAGVGLSLKNEGSAVDVLVPLGLVFGNAVRDGTGLLSSSAFPNAQEFNDISAALNDIVETRVLPELQRTASVGKRVQFVGCVEVADEDQDLKPLKLVPFFVKVE